MNGPFRTAAAVQAIAAAHAADPLPPALLDALPFPLITDVHAHLTDSPDELHRIPELRTSRVWLMGTRPSDWSIVLQAHQSWPQKIAMALGVHPWFAHSVDAPERAVPSASSQPEWLLDLRSHLLQHPRAMVGEIGLDGVATHPGTRTKYPMPHQLAVFEAQFDLAAELARPVSIHAVQCAGRIADFFIDRAKGFPTTSKRKQRLREREARLLREESDAEEDKEDDSDHAETTEAKAGLSATKSDRSSTEEQPGNSASDFIPTKDAQEPISSAEKTTDTHADLVDPDARTRAAILARWPPQIMLHSFSGSPDLVRRLIALPKPIASRFYFSFSHAINARSGAADRIRAVPDDRVLVESDLHDARLVDGGVARAVAMVAEAKGWELVQAAEVTGRNANAFEAGY